MVLQNDSRAISRNPSAPFFTAKHCCVLRSRRIGAESQAVSNCSCSSKLHDIGVHGWQPPALPGALRRPGAVRLRLRMQAPTSRILAC